MRVRERPSVLGTIRVFDVKMEGWNLDIFKSKCEMILVVNDGEG